MREAIEHEATEDEKPDPKVMVHGSHAIVVALKCSSCLKVTMIADPKAVASAKQGARLRAQCGGCKRMVVSTVIPKATRVEMSRKDNLIQVVRR